MKTKKYTYKDFNDKLITIEGWWGPEDGTNMGYWVKPNDKYQRYEELPSLKTDKVFKLIKKAGFNVVEQTNDPIDVRPSSVKRAMDLCKKHGLFYQIAYSKLADMASYHDDKEPDMEKVASSEQIKKDLGEYLLRDECYGLFLVDEPFEKSYPMLKKSLENYKQAIKELGIPDKRYFINLLPLSGMTGTKIEQYEHYVSGIVDVVNSDIICFDYYPFTWNDEENDRMSPGIYNLLGINRKIALKKGVRLGTCIQMGGNWTEEADNVGVRRPLYEEVLWEVNLALAYGCTFIEYFTLCTPFSFFKYLSNNGQTGAFDPWGKPTDLYYAAKKANLQALYLSEILMKCKSKRIIMDKNIPSFTEWEFEDIVKGGGYKELTKIDGEGCITGCFDYNGKTVLYVVNDFRNDGEITLHFKKPVDLSIMTTKTKNKKQVKDLTLSFKKGEAKLIYIK